jgi:hypothetical protein
MVCYLCGERAQGFVPATDVIAAHVCQLCRSCCVWVQYWTAAETRGVRRPGGVQYPRRPEAARLYRQPRLDEGYSGWEQPEL